MADRRGTKDSVKSDWTAELPAQHDDAGCPVAAAGRLVQRSWTRRFGTQFAALFKKNLLVNWRNLRATILRIVAPLFFMLLLFLVNLAIKEDAPQQPYAISNMKPAVDAVNPIPACEQDFYLRSPCYDFFYTAEGDANNVVRDVIVPFIQQHNPGRVIPDSKILTFASRNETNTWLLANPERIPGGIHFSVRDPGQFDFLLQVNTSVKFFRDQFQDPNFFAQVPLQVAAERAISQYYYNQAGRSGAGLDWQVSASMFAHPTTDSINIIGQSIGGFVFAANMFSFVLVLSAVVLEREKGLRQALKTMGMLDSAFWMSWLAVEVIAAVLFTLLLIAFGAMFQFEFFLKNSFALVFLLFFLFQCSMVSVACLLSTLVSRSSTAINLGFVVFLVGWIFQSVVVFGFPYVPDYIGKIPVLTAIITLMPWAPLAKAAQDLGAASEDEQSYGISWSNRSGYCMNIKDPAAQDAAFKPGVYQDFDCVFPIPSVLAILFVEAIVYFLLAVYLDNVLADENGVRKGKPWYFLTPSYWGCCGSSKSARSLKAPLSRAAMLVEGAERDVDVRGEEQRMQDLLQHRSGSGAALSLEGDSANAVEVYGLQKVFSPTMCGGRGCCGVCCFCCPKKGGRPGSGEFWAIKGSWFAIERNRLFCLLGPNGAGKTTTINCLTGVLPPSGGDALVYGESLSTPGGMDRIRSLMGVCPQFDVLWGELSGLEHLYLYGQVKGLPKAEVRRQAVDLLDSVKLTSAAKMRTAAYSGGMRRRLSVAIALLGDPLVVYLDEPTTGMDPISRRHVWDIIESSKPGRAIVLTTHSMEEADILGDKIAIMARGRVRAIGTSLRLKARFGSGYQLSVSVLPSRAGIMSSEAAAAMAVSATAVKEMFLGELGVEPAEESKAYITFLVPKQQEEALPAFLQRLDERRQELGVTDVQIGLTSLEEVFLAIARKAELEAAADEGRTMVTVELEDGAGSLEVAMGEEYATHPTTGRHYFLRWAQDDSGSLQVLKAVPVDRLPSLPSSGNLAGGAAVVGNGAGGSSTAGASAAAGSAPPATLEMSRKHV